MSKHIKSVEETQRCRWIDIILRFQVLHLQLLFVPLPSPSPRFPDWLDMFWHVFLPGNFHRRQLCGQGRRLLQKMSGWPSEQSGEERRGEERRREEKRCEGRKTMLRCSGWQRKQRLTFWTKFCPISEVVADNSFDRGIYLFRANRVKLITRQTKFEASLQCLSKSVRHINFIRKRRHRSRVSLCDMLRAEAITESNSLINVIGLSILPYSCLPSCLPSIPPFVKRLMAAHNASDT